MSWFNRRPTRRALALWLLPLGFVTAFFFYPLLKILMLAGEGGAGAVTWLAVWRPLRFTLFQAGLSTLLTLLVGLPAAFVFGRFDFPGKRLLSALTTLPFILPVVTAAAGFNALIGPNGWLNLLVMQTFGLENPPITLLNTLGAILLGHVFYNTAIVIRLVGSAWAGLDLRLEHAARVLGASPWQALKEVTLPLLRPAILSATLLVFLFDFTSFGVVLMLGGPHFATLEVEIYIQTLQMLNLPLAGVLSLIQLGFTGLFIVLSGRLGGASIPLAPRLAGEGIRRPRSAREWVVVLGGVLTLAGLLLSPLLALVARSLISLESGNLTLVYYRELFINRRQSLFYVPPAQAALNSLLVAVLATGLALLLGMLAAYAAREKIRAFTRSGGSPDAAIWVLRPSPLGWVLSSPMASWRVPRAFRFCCRWPMPWPGCLSCCGPCSQPWPPSRLPSGKPQPCWAPRPGASGARWIYPSSAGRPWWVGCLPSPSAWVSLALPPF